MIYVSSGNMLNPADVLRIQAFPAGTKLYCEFLTPPDSSVPFTYVYANDKPGLVTNINGPIKIYEVDISPDDRG